MLSFKTPLSSYITPTTYHPLHTIDPHHPHLQIHTQKIQEGGGVVTKNAYFISLPPLASSSHQLHNPKLTIPPPKPRQHTTRTQPITHHKTNTIHKT